MPAAADPAWHTGLLARLSPAGQVLTALALMAALQVAALPSQNPVDAVVSLLVYAPGGIVLFPLASALIGLAAFTWARQLRRAGRHWAAGCAAVAGVSLLLLGVFPTDPPGVAGMSLSAAIHRYAALAMFVAIPAAAILGGRAHLSSGAGPAARRRRWALHALVAICLLTAGPALIAVFAESLPDGWQRLAVACHAVRGLVERLQLVSMMAIVIVGVSLSRGAARRVPESRASRAGHRHGRNSGRRMTTSPGRLVPDVSAGTGGERGGLDPLSGAAPAATMVE